MELLIRNEIITQGYEIISNSSIAQMITCSSTLVTVLAQYVCYFALLVFGRETLRLAAAAEVKRKAASAQYQMHSDEHLHVHQMATESPRQQRMRHRHSEVVAEQVSSGEEQLDDLQLDTPTVSTHREEQVSSGEEQLDDLQLHRAVWMIGGNPNPAISGAASARNQRLAEQAVAAAAAAVAATTLARGTAHPPGLEDLKRLVRPLTYDGDDTK